MILRNQGCKRAPNPFQKGLQRDSAKAFSFQTESTKLCGAGLAFNPIDGMLQASPYVFALFLVPMHFFTHELLLFMTAVWTTNIHDCIDGQVSSNFAFSSSTSRRRIMGASLLTVCLNTCDQHP
jgi:hypothetical protein